MSYTISAVYANKDGSVYAQDYNGELWVFGTHFNSYESATRMAMKIECAKVINLQYWYKKVDQITQCDCAGCHKGIFVTRRGPVPCNQCRGKGFKNADDRKRTVNYFTYAYHPQGQNTPSHPHTHTPTLRPHHGPTKAIRSLRSLTKIKHMAASRPMSLYVRHEKQTLCI